jgi:hypothetical protein
MCHSGARLRLQTPRSVRDAPEQVVNSASNDQKDS